VGNAGQSIAFAVFLATYVAVGWLVRRAWRAGRIRTRTVALVRAGRWAAIPAFVAATGGWLITPLAVVLIVSAFGLSAFLHLRMLSWLGVT
jgi:hypothetical protein